MIILSNLPPAPPVVVDPKGVKKLLRGLKPDKALGPEKKSHLVFKKK